MLCEFCGGSLAFESAYLLPVLVKRQGKYPNLLTCSKRCYTEWVSKRASEGPQEIREQPVEITRTLKKRIQNNTDNLQTAKEYFNEQ